MSTAVENNDNNKDVPTPTEEIKFTERMRKATRKEHRISDALINAKMTIGNATSCTLLEGMDCPKIQLQLFPVFVYLGEPLV